MSRTNKAFTVTTAAGSARLRVKRGPSKTDKRPYWEARDGTGEHVWAGRATRLEAKAAAEMALEARKEQRAQDELRARGDHDVAETVTDLLAFYIGDCLTRAEAGELLPGTIRTYKDQRRRLRQDIGDIRCSRLDGDVLVRYQRRRMARGDAPSTFHIDIGLLRAAWKWAMARGVVEPRVIAWPKTSKRTTRPKPTPTKEQVPLVWAELAKWPADQDALLFLATTGARQGEMSKARGADFDAKGRRVRLQSKRNLRAGKTGERWVPLSDSCFRMLLRRYMALEDKEDGLLFGSIHRGKTLRDKRLGPICERLGIARLTPHAFRRFVSTELLERNPTAADYRAVMGHTKAQGEADYEASREQRARSMVLDALGDVIGGE